MFANRCNVGHTEIYIRDRWREESWGGEKRQGSKRIVTWNTQSSDDKRGLFGLWMRKQKKNALIVLVLSASMSLPWGLWLSSQFHLYIWKTKKANKVEKNNKHCISCSNTLNGFASIAFSCVILILILKEVIKLSPLMSYIQQQWKQCIRQIKIYSINIIKNPGKLCNRCLIENNRN